MRRKYRDCQRADGDCSACSLVNHGMDCHNRTITKLEWYRRGAQMELGQLAELSGVNMRQIQKVESGEIDAGRMSARNLLAIADALAVDPRELI